MHAFTAIEPAPVSPRTEPFDRAERVFAAFRGEWINSFARGEEVLNRTLLLLGQKPDLLVGKRIDALIKALPPRSPHAGAATAALAGFSEHADLRNLLCHASARALVDRQGCWTTLLTMHLRTDGAVQLVTRWIDAADHADMLTAIGGSSQRLSQMLGHFRNEAAV
jgi:hypothetical protein